MSKIACMLLLLASCSQVHGPQSVVSTGQMAMDASADVDAADEPDAGQKPTTCASYNVDGACDGVCQGTCSGECVLPNGINCAGKCDGRCNGVCVTCE